MSLSINEVSKVFGGVAALSDVSFSVEPGSIFGLIGPNGAGKTTLFNIIAGVFKPTKGSILMNGRHLENEPNYLRIDRSIARTFQNIRLFPNLTVLQNIVVGMHNKLRCTMIEAILRSARWRAEESAAKLRAMELLDTFGLANRRDAIAKSLPYGEQRILEITRALVTDSGVLLLDEPAAGLNNVESARLVDFIRMIRDKMGRTILLVEHDMNVVMKVCERLVVLDHGVKIAEGEPREIQKDKQVIGAYLGRKFADEACC
ncbi:MAG: ABC transporter ATP-binding protein [Synergistaceae bacterium]|jgi:branched-chain amino acid transport system ATP-binding protein|nr:ABC transporter ATP-binding protein [Synergistaceae bacterium]